MSADAEQPPADDATCGRLGCTEPAAALVELPDGRERVLCEDCARPFEVIGAYV